MMKKPIKPTGDKFAAMVKQAGTELRKPPPPAARKPTIREVKKPVRKK